MPKTENLDYEVLVGEELESYAKERADTVKQNVKWLLNNAQVVRPDKPMM